MGQLNGMETARKLRALSCNIPIIFLTASPDFAVESYEVQASGDLFEILFRGENKEAFESYSEDRYATQGCN